MRVIDLDAVVSHGGFQLEVPDEQLNRAKG